MFGKILPASVLAALLGTTPVLADLAGPAELPPSSYKGQQYVDSRGCVFLRAGYGGQVTWVPRVTRDRKQLCGYGPSGGKVEVAEEAPAKAPEKTTVAAAPAPEPTVVKPAAKAVAKAAPSPAPAPTIAAAPKAPAADRPATATELAATGSATVVVQPQGGAGYRLACPAETPVAERFAVTTGGTKVLCTRGDGTLIGANFPMLVEGSTDGHAIGYDAHVAAGSAPVVIGGAEGTAKGDYVYTVSGAGTKTKTSKSSKYPSMVPPKGYKMAWKDDRLNPNRGKQTVEGFLEMDEIWTRTVPAELREDSKIKKRPVTIIVRRTDGTQTKHDGYVVVSSKGGETVEFANPNEAVKVSKSTKAVAPEAVKPVAKTKAESTGGRFLVQVGTFGVTSNAESAAGRLKGIGLPVARASIKGGAMTVIYAGPFASAAAAKSALSAARGAGFSDAMIVQ